MWPEANTCFAKEEIVTFLFLTYSMLHVVLILIENVSVFSYNYFLHIESYEFLVLEKNQKLAFVFVMTIISIFF